MERGLGKEGIEDERAKTEYMHVNGEQEGTIRLAGTDVKKVQEFKYLGSTVQQNGDSDREVKKRIQAGWHNWRKVSGVVCDRKIHPKVKGKVYRTVVRPATTYGQETWLAQETRGRDGGGGTKNAEILSGSDTEGQD